MPFKSFGGFLLLPFNLTGKHEFEKVPYTKTTEDKISAQLVDQLPDFVVSNYETFVQFVEAYYEWLEQKDQSRFEAVNLKSYKDIDETLDEFVEYFRSTYINDFPFEFADGVNEKTIVKYANDLYRSKGTESSFKLLFKILYDSNVSISYPRDRVLRLSTSTYEDNKFIRIEPIFSVDTAKLAVGGLIVQKDPFGGTITATAKIRDITYREKGGFDFFTISIQDISGSFNGETPIEITTIEETPRKFKANIIPTLSSIDTRFNMGDLNTGGFTVIDPFDINFGGKFYEIGDKITTKDSQGRTILTSVVSSTGLREQPGSILQLSTTGIFGNYLPRPTVVVTAADQLFVQSAAGLRTVVLDVNDPAPKKPNALGKYFNHIFEIVAGTGVGQRLKVLNHFTLNDGISRLFFGDFQRFDPIPDETSQYILISPHGLEFDVESENGTEAIFFPNDLTYVTDLPDTYSDDSGKLSSRYFIQDNFYYQDFSYVLRTNKALSVFAKTVKRLVHPSSFLMLSEFLNETTISEVPEITSVRARNFNPKIGNYLAHTFGMTLDPRGFTLTSINGSTFTDFYPTGWNGQDGRTAGDFFGVELANTRYGTPHADPYSIGMGITHDPTKVYTSSNTPLDHDDIEVLFSIPDGALLKGRGRVDLLPFFFDGATATEEEKQINRYLNTNRVVTNSLFGFFPQIPKDISNHPEYTLYPPVSQINTPSSTYGNGVTHYGGYFSPTSALSSFGPGQDIPTIQTPQTEAESATADYWIVYRHPAHAGLTFVGPTGERNIVSIPIAKDLGLELPSPFFSSKDGYERIESGFTLTINSGSTYEIGEIVKQDTGDLLAIPNVFARVVDFIPSAYDHNSIFVTGHPNPDKVLENATKLFNIGTDTLVVELLTGNFVGEGNYPVVGESSGTSRLISSDEFVFNNIVQGVTYDTTWLDVPILPMLSEENVYTTGTGDAG